MTAEPGKGSNLEVSIAVVGLGALLVCIVIVLRSFLPALLWAGVLAVAIWPTYEGVVGWRRSAIWKRILAPLLCTLAVGLVVATPVAFGALEIGHESRAIMGWLFYAHENGIPLPASVARLPYFGANIAAWWQDNLGTGQSASDLVRRMGPGQLAGWTRSIGIGILDRALLFVIMLVTLFFFFRDGETLSARLVRFSRKMFGDRSEHVLRQIVNAIHGTVDGMVLVGLAEGAVLGIAYGIAGVPYPFAFAVVTAILAIIPFGAPLAFCCASLLLLGGGHDTAAIALVVFGFSVLFIADHIIRPVLIGGAARIPFLLVLLGILGGLASFGLVGVFVGPALMAVLVTLWDDFTNPAPRES